MRAFVRYTSSGTMGWLDGSDVRKTVDCVAGDVTDPDSVQRAVAERDVVFHLASLIAIPYSYQAPASYVRTNVEGTLNVLRAARDHGVSRMIHTSTSEVYGSARYVPIDEEHPLQGQSPYSASKIGADQMAMAFHRSFDVPVVTVRPFNTFGPRQSDRAVIPTIVSQCLTGGTVKLGNLDATRDMNFVSDTVDGFLRAASSADAVGGTFNLGSGREISIGDLARTIGEVAGREVTVVVDEQRMRPEGSEVDRLCADGSKAREVLGWMPAVSLEEGLARTVEWIAGNLDRYRPEDYVV